jgi:hypothetical protein
LFPILFWSLLRVRICTGDSMKKVNTQINETLFLRKTDEAIILEKIEIALKQLESGEFLTSEELDKEIDSWDW